MPDRLSISNIRLSVGQAVEEARQAAGVGGGDARAVTGVAFLECGGDADAAVAEYLAEDADGTRGLVEKYVPRPWGGRCDYHDSPFALHKRTRHGRLVIIHHGVDHAVKQSFQLSGHIAPIAWRSEHYEVMVTQERGKAVSVIIGQYAGASAAASHAAGAMPVGRCPDSKLRDTVSVCFEGFFSHAEEPADVSVDTR